MGLVKKKAITHITVRFAPKASCECDIFLNEEDQFFGAVSTKVAVVSYGLPSPAFTGTNLKCNTAKCKLQTDTESVGSVGGVFGVLKNRKY